VIEVKRDGKWVKKQTCKFVLAAVVRHLWL